MKFVSHLRIRSYHTAGWEKRLSRNNQSIFNWNNLPPNWQSQPNAYCVGMYVLNFPMLVDGSIYMFLYIKICVWCVVVSTYVRIYVYCRVVCAGTRPRWLMVVETKSWDNAHGNDLWSGSSGALSVAYLSLWSGSTFVKYKYKYKYIYKYKYKYKYKIM